MKRILVPTDLSKLSRAAAVYAVNLSKRIGADVVLLSVINASSSPNTLVNWRKLEEKMVSKAQQDADKMIQEIRKETGTEVGISYQHILGFPVEEMIERFGTENKIDFIVMGTKGATGLNKVLLGSNTSAVIGHSSVPVIALPGEAAFKPINRIVYASNMVHLEKEIKIVAQFAGYFDAAVEILHVIPNNPSKRNRSALEQILVRMAKYPKIHFNVIENPNIAEGVNSFVLDKKADLLAMFTHEPDFYEKFFGKSVTRQLAFHTHVPLLTFNKKIFNKWKPTSRKKLKK